MCGGLGFLLVFRASSFSETCNQSVPDRDNQTACVVDRVNLRRFKFEEYYAQSICWPVQHSCRREVGAQRLRPTDVAVL